MGEAKPATIIEDNSSASSSDNDENIKPSHKFRNESPDQNHENHEMGGRRSTNGIDVTKIYTQGMDNNNEKTINNNNNNVEKMGETRTKPTRDITQNCTLESWTMQEAKQQTLLINQDQESTICPRLLTKMPFDKPMTT